MAKEMERRGSFDPERLADRVARDNADRKVERSLAKNSKLPAKMVKDASQAIAMNVIKQFMDNDVNRRTMMTFARTISEDKASKIPAAQRKAAKQARYESRGLPFDEDHPVPVEVATENIDRLAEKIAYELKPDAQKVPIISNPSFMQKLQTSLSSIAAGGPLLDATAIRSDRNLTKLATTQDMALRLQDRDIAHRHVRDARQDKTMLDYYFSQESGLANLYNLIASDSTLQQKWYNDERRWRRESFNYNNGGSGFAVSMFDNRSGLQKTKDWLRSKLFVETQIEQAAGMTNQMVSLFTSVAGSSIGYGLAKLGIRPTVASALIWPVRTAFNTVAMMAGFFSSIMTLGTSRLALGAANMIDPPTRIGPQIGVVRRLMYFLMGPIRMMQSLTTLGTAVATNPSAAISLGTGSMLKTVAKVMRFIFGSAKFVFGIASFIAGAMVTDLIANPQKMVEYGKAFVNIWSNYISPAFKWLAETANNIMDAIADLFGGGAAEEAGSGFQRIGAFFNDVFLYTLNEVLPPILDTLGKIIKTAAKVIGEIYKTIVGLFGIGEYGNRSFFWLLNNVINQVAEGIIGVMKALWDGIVDLFRLDEVAAWLGELIQPFITNVINPAYDAVRDAVNAVVEVFTNVKDTIVGIFNFIKEKIEALVQGIRDIQTYVRDTINAAIDAIDSFVHGGRTQAQRDADAQVAQRNEEFRRRTGLIPTPDSGTNELNLIAPLNDTATTPLQVPDAIEQFRRQHAAANGGNTTVIAPTTINGAGGGGGGSSGRSDRPRGRPSTAPVNPSVFDRRMFGIEGR